MSQSSESRGAEAVATCNLDGRFQIEEVLGRGGMGAVYRAYAPALGRKVALKRLSNGADLSHVSLFEREYHTLVSLRHPNVVEAFDYGTDAEGPWYSMELLEGGDLSRSAPLPWRDVCKILREVSSALALIHGRRLLHRDISARNVWRTPDGRVKLIDFGALCAFGKVTHITGTPPYIAPEALHDEALDQRTDLYALGVLGYYLLTGLYPFPARELSDLRECWRNTPKVPSERVAELCRSDLTPPPAELDALIEALLQQDPLARPGSAAELIERLDVIAPPSGAKDEAVSAGALGKTAFVGRAQATDLLRRAFELADGGIGSAAMIEAERGLGRTRLLTEFALSVRFAGAVALQVDPAPYRGELYGVAQAFALKLLELLPELSRRMAAPHAAVLGHVSPALRVRLGLSAAALVDLPDTPGEARMRIQAALAEWFFDVARDRPLVLLADDLHWYDEASAAWLATLARSANQTKLLVVGSLPVDAIEHLEHAVQSLRQAATPVALPPLDNKEMLELVRSLFGEAPRLGRLAETLHRVSGGRPAYALELLEHLAHRGTIAYSDGAWVLPHNLAAAELPTRDAALAARLSRLNPEARALAQPLSVVEGRIRAGAVMALSPLDPLATSRALEQLVSEGVLTMADGDYALASEDVQKLLESELDERRRAATHRTLGELMLRAGVRTASERLRAGVHFMRAGDMERGCALVCGACADLSITRVIEQSVSVESMELALRLMRQYERSIHEQRPVLGALTAAGFYVDRRLALRYGPDAVEAFARAINLPLARRLRPFLGRTFSLLLALALAALAIGLRGRKKNGGLDFQNTIVLMFSSVAALTGVAAICIDPKAAAAYASVIEPLSALGKNHAAGLVHEFCVALASTVSDRIGEAYARWEALTARLRSDEPIRELPDSLRVFYMAGGLYALGVMASWRDDRRALTIADELDALKLKLYEMNADQVRMMYYGNQGDRARFEHYRERVEMHAIQRGTAWQAETWAAAAQLTVYLRTFDGTRMKHCVDQLERIGAEVPSMAHFIDRGRGFYLLLRDRPKEAAPLLEPALAAEPMEQVSWAGWSGTLAWAYNASGEHERARALCQKVLSHLSPEDRAFPAMNLIPETELALAEAHLGRCELASRQIDALLTAHASGQGALTLGAIHATGARVALLAGDDALFERHLAGMRRHYLPTRTASLIEHCDRIEKLRRRASQPLQEDGPLSAEQLREHVHTVLYRIRHGGSGSALERAHWALSQLARYLPVSEGHVYVAGEQGAQRIAMLNDQQVSGEIESQAASDQAFQRIDAWVRQRMVARAGSETVTARFQDLAALATINEIELPGRRFRLIFLELPEGTENTLVGALLVPRDIAEQIPHSVLEAVASRLKTLTTERRLLRDGLAG